MVVKSILTPPATTIPHWQTATQIDLLQSGC